MLVWNSICQSMAVYVGMVRTWDSRPRTEGAVLDWGCITIADADLILSSC